MILGGNIAGVAMTIDFGANTHRGPTESSWALVYNAACVPLAVAGYLLTWLAGLGMATSSLLVVNQCLTSCAVFAESNKWTSFIC